MSEHRKGWGMPEKPKKQKGEASPLEEAQAAIDSLEKGINSLDGEILSEKMAKIKFREIEYLMKEYENNPSVKKGYFGVRPFKEKSISFIAGLDRVMLILKRIPTQLGGGKFVLVSDYPGILNKLLLDNTIAIEMRQNSNIWKKKQDKIDQRKIKSAQRDNFLRERELEEQRISDLFIEKFNNKIFLSYDMVNGALREIRRAIFDYGRKYGGGRMEDDTLSRIEKKLKRKLEMQRITQVRFKIVEGKQRMSVAVSLNRLQDGSLELWCADGSIISR